MAGDKISSLNTAIREAIPHMQKVGFAEPHAAVDKQGIVLAARIVSDGSAGCCGELVRRTDDKRVENVARKQLLTGFEALGRRLVFGTGRVATGRPVTGTARGCARWHKLHSMSCPAT